MFLNTCEAKRRVSLALCPGGAWTKKQAILAKPYFKMKKYI